MGNLCESAPAADSLGCGMAAITPIGEELVSPHFRYEAVFRDPDGVELWRGIFENLVTTAGKTDCLNQYFKGSGYTAAWFLGLKGAGTAVVADTLASHASWTEVSAYSGNRPAITFGTTSGGSNTATGVVFTFTGTFAVSGAFICQAATGTSALLYSVGDFGFPVSGGTGSTLTVTPTVSIS